jgi:radical SAM protein with 4Fe4S-binding SPASM domain
MNKIIDLDSQPLIAIWETSVPHGRCRDQNFRPADAKLELNDDEAEQLIRDVAELKPPVFVFAGADPMRRHGIYSLVQYAASCNLHPVIQLTPASSVTQQTIAALKSSSLSRLSFTLDGAESASHDVLSGIPGSFARTLQSIKWANEGRLPVQIHTNISRRNLSELSAMASLLMKYRIVTWSISFPVPGPDDSLRDLPSATEFEEAFQAIYSLAQKVPFKVKTLEAQHYRRYVLQQRTRFRAFNGESGRFPFFDMGIPGVLPVNEGVSTVYIKHNGDVLAGRSLDFPVGNVRRDKLVALYQNSSIFQSLRDPANLKGKCGNCEFKEMCGGSRGRAWALSGDMFGQEESCMYLPLQGRNDQVVS